MGPHEHTLRREVWERRRLNGLLDGIAGRGLDLGCGAQPMRWWVWVPEVDEVRLWDLRRGDGDAQALEGVPDGAYDFVLSSHLLEHVPDPEEALRHWCRVVRPGGRVLLVVPHRELYEGRQRRPSRWNPNHLRYYLPDRHDAPDTVGLLPWLREQEQAAGFRVLRLQTGDWDWHRPAANQHPPGEFQIDALLEVL